MPSLCAASSASEIALEASQRLQITANLLRQKFKGHEAVQACVLGFVDYPHATTAELVGDSIVGDGLTDHLCDILGVTLGEVNGNTGTGAPRTNRSRTPWWVPGPGKPGSLQN